MTINRSNSGAVCLAGLFLLSLVPAADAVQIISTEQALMRKENSNFRQTLHGRTVEADLSQKAEDISSCLVADERNKARCVDSKSMRAPTNALHVVYAADPRMVKGMQASMSSVITSSSDPAQLVFHLMVQAERAPDFAKAFGLPEDCRATVTPKGTQIQIVSFEKKDLLNSVAEIPHKIESQRGHIDSVENFARFYMHRLIPGVELAIYLDADTIVQKDLHHLHNMLLTSNKTIGFVARPEWHHDATMRSQLNLTASTWSTELLDTTAYNAGVFAINLKRWAEHGMSESIEKLVHRHNECGGKLWIGGSQPPLLLTFLDRKPDAPKDYIVFDSEWNYEGLGCGRQDSPKTLAAKGVLHWNGKHKPWAADGAYKGIFQPHCDQFSNLICGPAAQSSQLLELQEVHEDCSEKYDPMDYVVVAAESDCVLEKVIESLHSFAAPRRILLIMPANACKESAFPPDSKVHCLEEGAVLAEISKNTTQDWIKAKFGDKVLRERFGEGAHSMAGWYLQQFLKMGISEVADKLELSENYVLWDSDMVLMRKTCPFNLHGKVNLMQGQDPPTSFCNHNYDKSFPKLTGMPYQYSKAGTGFTAHHMVVNRRAMQSLLDRIQQDGAGKHWSTTILEASCPDVVACSCGFSEYGSYASWMLQQHPDDVVETPKNFDREGKIPDPHVGCCPSQYQHYMEQSAKKGLAFVAFERKCGKLQHNDGTYVKTDYHA